MMSKRKIKRRREFGITIFFLLFYIVLSINYYNGIKDYSYIGIRVQNKDNTWIVKSIEDDGNASVTDVKVGDEVLTIDEEIVSKNSLIRRWLIVEQAKRISVVQNGVVKEIIFKEDKSVVQKFNIFNLIGLLCFVFLLYYITKQNGGYSEKVFFLFVMLIAFSLVSLVPSSMGIFEGRLIIVVFVSVCPLFLDLFLKTYKQTSMYEKAYIYIFELSIAIVNIILCIATAFVNLPYMMLEYLAQGIFGVWGILSVLVFVKNKHIITENSNVSNTNIYVFSIIGFLPLFLFYIFPLKWEAPFSLLIPFALLPIAGVFHALVVSKLTAHRYKIKEQYLYIIFSGILICIIVIAVLLCQYIPIYVVGLYNFWLIASLLPLLEEILLITKRSNRQINSLQLFSAIEEERENIAIAIHDTIIQDVIYSVKVLEATKEATIKKQDVMHILDETIFELRELCSDIYPLMIQELGLKKALLAMFNQMQKKYPVIIQNNIEECELAFSTQKSNFILRSVKELINNSVLHGKANHIQVLIMNDEKYCYLTVSDNGSYIYKRENKVNSLHYGLDVINEKLVLLNGELIINTDTETKITIKIPFDVEAEDDKNSIAR